MVTDDEKMEELKEIWLRNETRLYRIARQRLQSCPNDIEDVVSQVKIIFFERLLSPDKEPPHLIDEWLSGVLHNIIKQTYEQNNKNKEKLVTLDENDDSIYLPCVEMDMEEVIIINNLDFDDLEKQLYSELKPKEAFVLIEHYVKKRKYKDIAEELGETVGAVKERAYRSVNKARKLAPELVEKNS